MLQLQKIFLPRSKEFGAPYSNLDILIGLKADDTRLELQRTANIDRTVLNASHLLPKTRIRDHIIRKFEYT
jgi:hypothetical protein